MRSLFQRPWIAVLAAGVLIPACGGGPVDSRRVSVASDGSEGNAGVGGVFSNAYNFSLSEDGRFVAFQSEATNLVPGDMNNSSDIFVRDRTLGTTTRVSVASGGGEAGGPSGNPSISADGSRVAFWSNAANLVAGDTNGAEDVFVHDRLTGQTVLASVDASGNQGNGTSYAPSMSADGSRVAFWSRASNLVPGDLSGGGGTDVFVRDLQTGETLRASVTSAGNDADSDSFAPALSGDGRFVAFFSYASNLVAGDTNGQPEIFLRDLATGTTERASVATGGAEADFDSWTPFVSADGRFVLFESRASNLVPDDTNGTWDVFLRDRLTGETRRVSLADGGGQANEHSLFGTLSKDGRYVAFMSNATNLIAADTNDRLDIFVHDLNTAGTTRVSVAADGTQANERSDSPRISADGKWIAFVSDATNLVGDDRNGVNDLFMVPNPTAP